MPRRMITVWPANQSLQPLQEALSDDLQIEIIDDLSRFNEIAKEWDELVDRSGLERPFLSHAWLRIWWEAFAGTLESLLSKIDSQSDVLGCRC